MQMFRNYLSKVISKTKQKTLKPIRICLGNVSADMDSVVGSMALSYYYHLKNNDQFFIPVINSQKSDFFLKLEQVLHFNNCSLDVDQHALFYNDLKSMIDGQDLQEVALFDHNKLDKSQENILGDKVTKIVDHHVDCNEYTNTLKEKHIELIGSATSLVAERFIQEFPEIVDKDFAYFLAAPIVLDSYYFKDTLKDTKWTDKDLKVYEYLQKQSNLNKSYWEQYNNAKYDVELNLKSGFKNIMIKDYKTYYLLKSGQIGIGVASAFVPLSKMHEYFSIDEELIEIDKLMEEKKLGLFSIVTNYQGNDGNYKRELLFYMNPALLSAEETRFYELLKYLDSNEGYQLKNKVMIERKGIVVQWDVGNVAYSRKDLEVLLRQFYEQQQHHL